MKEGSEMKEYGLLTDRQKYLRDYFVRYYQKDAYMQLLLHLNDDFDDDLLMDAMSLL